MRMGYKGRAALLALAVLCLSLFVAVPVALAGFGGETFFSGTTTGVALNKTAPVTCALRIQGTVTNPASSDTVDTGLFFSTTSGLYNLLVNAGPTGYYTDLNVTIGVWDPTLNLGLGGLSNSWLPLMSMPIEALPDQIVTTAWTLVPAPDTLKGTIKNSKTGAKIKGAKVTVLGRSVTTSKSGAYSFTNLALWPGIKVSIKVSKSGYNTHTVKVLPVPAGTKTTNITLKKK